MLTPTEHLKTESLHPHTLAIKTQTQRPWGFALFVTSSPSLYLDLLNSPSRFSLSTTVRAASIVRANDDAAGPEAPALSPPLLRETCPRTHVSAPQQRNGMASERKRPPLRLRANYFPPPSALLPPAKIPASVPGHTFLCVSSKQVLLITLPQFLSCTLEARSSITPATFSFEYPRSNTHLLLTVPNFLSCYLEATSSIKTAGVCQHFMCPAWCCRRQQRKR